jgi:hypothetical protein
MNNHHLILSLFLISQTFCSAAPLAPPRIPEVLKSVNAEVFGTNGIDHIASAKNLRQLTLQHGLACDANVALLSQHPALEKVWLWSHGPYAILTDAAIPSLATLPNHNSGAI